MEAERRQVTVLFADMVGFTTYAEQFGDEAAFTLMQSLAKLMDDVIREEGGGVHDYAGDGVMAVFGAPVALEDAPLRACRAAASILQRLSASADDLETRHGVRPQVRIGVNAGPAVVGQVQGGADANVAVLGDTVNLAARLQALAWPGTAVLSEAMNKLARGSVETSFQGEFAVKGKSEPQKVFRLEGVLRGAARFDASVHRGLTIYVGRDRELDRLERALDAIAGGLQVIDITGEPGIGKSRLLHEFREQIVKDRARILTVSCAPDERQTPFHAFIEVVRGAFRLESGDAEAAVADKMDNGLKALGLSSAENLGLLLNLLGLKPPDGALQELDGVLIGLRTRDLLRRVVQAHCRLTPMILVLEDLHWLDGASEEVLARIIAVEEPIQLLILHTRRPGYDPPWVGRPRVKPLPLLPLSARETSRIAQARIGVDPLPEPLAKLISAKADGNALFAEEIANFLVERGAVRRTASGLEFDPHGVSVALPDSLKSLLASRVDRLAPTARTLLQAAAVVGRRFDPELVAALGVAPAPRRAPFAAMEALDLVYRDEMSGEYVFKHALVRDAIYEGLLTKPRAELHLSVAEELERRHGNRLFEIAEALAYHYAATTRFGKAFAYLAMAGDKSLNVYAVPEAERYYRQALDVFEKHGECAEASSVARLLVRLLETLMLKCDYRDAGEIARKFMPFIKAAGETPDLVTAYYYQALSLVQALELRAAHELMVEALAIAERLGDGRARAYARGGLLQCRTRLGLDTLEDAEKMKAELIDDALRYGDNFIRNASYFFVIWDYLYRGLVREAREIVMRLIASGHERNDPRAIGFAHWMLGWTYVICGAPQASLTHADDCLRVAIAPIDRLQALAIKTVASIFLGQSAEGLAQVVALNAEFERLGARHLMMESPRGAALISLGRVAEGVAVIERSIRERDAAGDRTFANFSRVLLAEIYIQILTGGQKARVGVILRNLGALAHAKILGARRVQALLDEAASHKQWSERGFYFARLNFDRGQLALLRKRRGKAREYFARAKVAAEAQAETLLLGKIEAAAAGLG